MSARSTPAHRLPNSSRHCRRAAGLVLLAALLALTHCAGQSMPRGSAAPPANRTTPADSAPAEQPRPPTASGVDAKAIEAHQRTHAGAIRRCQRLARQRGRPVDEARLEVTLEVDPAGQVTGAELRGTADAAFRDCVSSSLRRWRFGAVGGEGATVVFPLVLRPPPAATTGRRIDVLEVDRLKREHEPQMMSCLERAVQRGSVRGELELTAVLLVMPAGSVQHVEVSGVEDTQLVSCVSQDLSRWRFRPLRGTAPVKVSFPLVFRGPAAEAPR